MSENKSVLFFAYANSEKDPLPTLKKENEEIYKLLSPRVQNGDFIIHRDAYASRESMIQHLTGFREHITVFHFSGHAGRDRLLLDDEVAHSEGIISLLSKCPKLKLVVLNGCSTQGQLKLITNQLKNHPVMISTSAPVEDESATTYGIELWRNMSKHNATIEKAHSQALAATKVYNRNITCTRDIGFEENTTEEFDGPIWDISTELSMNLDWRLPKNKNVSTENTNHILKEKLLTAFSKYDELIKKAWIDTSVDDTYKVTLLLEALPLPLSEQLRKLFARQSARDLDSGHKFYNRIGYDRLKQIVTSYQTLMETVSFIHLAQLWDHVHSDSLTLKEEDTTVLGTYFLLSRNDRKDYSLIQLCYRINKIFERKGVCNFLEEWNDPSNSINEQHLLFNESIDYLQGLLKKGEDVLKEDMATLCETAEEHLATIYAELAFLIRYKMTSVKAIGVKKYRHLSETNYNHSVIKLIQRFDTFDKEMILENDISADPKFTDSVFLSKPDGSYLNLTPFIIDENSFNPMAPLAKICHFSLRQKLKNGKEIYGFSHVYNREDNYLMIQDEANYEILKDQFNDFQSSILNLNATK
nr:hypothetical protein [uncultured bacterium]